MRNGDFNKSVILTLSKRAGAHCSICKVITSIPHQNPEKFHNLGEAAHIYGLKNRPNLRYDSNIDPKYLSSAKNGIWLCQSCHHIVDNDADTYTVKVLEKAKADHDALIIAIHSSGNKLMPELSKKDDEIRALKKLIKAREDLVDAKEIIYDTEVNRLKISLLDFEKQKVFLEDQLAKLKSELVSFNDENLNLLLRSNDLSEALDFISDVRLRENEAKLGKARLLKARVHLSKGEYETAETNFDKAFELWPSSYVALEFINVLYYIKLDYSKLIRIAKLAIENEEHPRVLVELNGQLSNALLKVGRARESLYCLQQALTILDSLEDQNAPMINVQLARLNKAAGDSYKLLGKIKEALNYYEISLNLYFRLALNSDEGATTSEFAGLATAIGLLYEQNNDEKEALIHHLRAKEVLKDIHDGKNTKALIFLNIATCYMKAANFDPEKAKHHVTSAIDILEDLSRERPNENLEYLVGARCQLADLHILSDLKIAFSCYEDALKLAEMLLQINPVFLAVVSHVKHNYAVSLLFGGQPVKGMKLLDESIEILRESKDYHARHVEELSSSLFLKLDFTSSNQEKRALLKEIIEINHDTDPFDKCILYKNKAEKMLHHFGADKE
ncbi:tetratricopeptide repeat protein [Sphingobacterium bambusae]|uniref:Tetratricopeptide repeat protein n=1 Tax=Sphingobacterium bambusae TaxID=662858 RepID=A0ABW6BEA2_9SPHI|nr:HNH endonuclease [Sphingobacterium bambusae]WPL48463.1 hypothetical protein SCB77_21170 [Sphingobacterium bambusae]